MTYSCTASIRLTVHLTAILPSVIRPGPPFRRERGANPRQRKGENNPALRTEGCTEILYLFISIHISTNIPRIIIQFKPI
jgi:hypothetical protein